MPSLKANVPAKITISNPKAIKITSWDDSILIFNYFVFYQSVNQQALQTFI